MTGIDVRHRKACTNPRDDGKCCGASYQAHVFDARTGQRIRKTFPTKTAARLWRQDAMAAIRAGETSALTPTATTVDDALDALLAGMTDGTILDRSGRRYRPATARSYREAADKYLRPA